MSHELPSSSTHTFGDDARARRGPEDLRRDLATSAHTDAELQEIYRIDAILHRGFQRLDEGTPSPGPRTIQEILDGVCPRGTDIIARRSRRTLRTVLWLTVLLLGLLASYGLVSLSLEVLKR